jgi:hypothetical protein
MNFKMKKAHLILIIIMVISGVVYLVYRDNNNQPEIFEPKNGEQQTIYLQEMFYEPENFTKAVKIAEKTLKKNNIYSIVVPHHLLASEYIAQLIKMSSGREIKTVVILGPNHEDIGSDCIATTKAKWDTPLGLVETNEKLVDNFTTDFKLKSDYQVFINEHSVGAIIPFVKYYLPQAKILPIIFSSYAGINEAEEISRWLTDNLSPESLIIVSTDFSHYLTKQQADQNDEIIRQLILEHDIDKIMVLNNDYIDSPISLAIVLIYANQNGLKTEIINNSNSFDFSMIKPTETTSYFAITFWR